jgi:hypothetical protein
MGGSGIQDEGCGYGRRRCGIGQGNLPGGSLRSLSHFAGFGIDLVRIDKTLIQRNEQKLNLQIILRTFVQKGCPFEDLPGLKEQIALKDKDTPSLLLDIMMEEEGEVSNLALFLLSEYATPKVAQSAEKLLNAPNISDIHRSRLAAFLLLHQESKHFLVESRKGDEFIRKFLYFLEAFWQQIDPIDVGRIWLEDYHKLPAREKIPLLKALFSTGSACYLPIYSIEIGSPQVSVSRFVASELRNVDHENTIVMLKSFPELKDTATRLSMEDSVKILQEKRRNGKLEPRRLDNIPSFYKAYIAEEESAGFMSVIFSKKLLNGSVRFSFTLIDRWDKGILSCYADLVESEDDFHQIVELLNQESGTIHYKNVTREYAAWVLRKAEILAIERDYSMPPEHLLCRCLLWEEPRSSRNYGIRFGLQCCECGEPIRMDSKENNTWLIGDLALCPECIRKKTRCENCGESVIPEKAYALARADVDHITIICEKCYRKARKKTKKSPAGK